MKTIRYFIASRINSFGFAFKGLAAFFQGEANARIHLLFTILVVITAYWLRVSLPETIALVIVTGLVWVAEILNTAIERTMDFISKGRNGEIKVTKDLAAAAVLLSALVAVITGALIFIPKMLSHVSKIS